MFKSNGNDKKAIDAASKEKKIRYEEFKNGEAAGEKKQKDKLADERKKLESRKTEFISWGRYDGLQQARAILDQMAEAGMRNRGASCYEIYLALQRARIQVSDRLDRAYDEAHGEVRRNVTGGQENQR